MKSVIYALLLALIPDLMLLKAGVSRVSSRAPHPFSFDVHARDGAILICALRRCRGDRRSDPTMKVVVDVFEHVARPLEFQDLGLPDVLLAGDREHSIDVEVELQMCSQLLQWLTLATAEGQKLDASADISDCSQ